MPRCSPMLRQNTKARQDINALQVLTLRQLRPPTPRRSSHAPQKPDFAAKSQRPAKFQCLDKVRHPCESSFVPNVPPERLRGGVCLRLSQGEAFLVASPRNAVTFLTPCSVFFVYKGDFAGKPCLPLRKGDKGRRPLDPCKPLRKA